MVVIFDKVKIVHKHDWYMNVGLIHVLFDYVLIRKK